MKTEKNPPELSIFAKSILFLAEKGEVGDIQKLQEWYAGIYHSWKELPIINKQYGGDYIKWRCGSEIQLLNQGERQYLHEDVECIEYQYAYNTTSLFKCFFRIFPEIDNVKTENITGLKFINPFLFLHEPDENRERNIEQITGNEFLFQAKACKESPEFMKEWKRLKAQVKNEDDYPRYGIGNGGLTRTLGIYSCPNQTHKTLTEEPGQCEICRLEKYRIEEKEELMTPQQRYDTTLAIRMKFERDLNLITDNDRLFLINMDTLRMDLNCIDSVKEILKGLEPVKEKPEAAAGGAGGGNNKKGIKLKFILPEIKCAACTQKFIPRNRQQIYCTECGSPAQRTKRSKFKKR